MVKSIQEYISQFNHLIEDEETDWEDVSSIYEDENNQLGQFTDEGDIVFTFKLPQGDQQSSEHTLDSRVYQQVLESQGFRLLDVYNSNVLYLCKKSVMETQITVHMAETNAYSLIERLTAKNPTCVQQHLDTIVKQVTTLLNGLVTSGSINDSQFRQMNVVQRSKVQMDYLFFLPDLRQENLVFQPIMVCSLGPTMAIARYISRLLQPIYDQVAFATTFFKETDAVHAIEMYANQGLLQPSTLFATIHINNLCTTLSHEEIMKALERFLNQYYKPDQFIQGIPIDTILKLIHLILQNQIFIFKNRVYRQIKGGANTSPLTILLMNIYMFYWQQELVNIMTNKKEIFGRCFDEVFLTWNSSKDQLHSLLYTTFNNPSSPIKIKTSIGKKINYIDAQISHIDGHIRTKINHDFDSDPRGLPYVSNHSRHIYATLIRAALIRAVLCCSNVSDFHHERRDIEEVCQINGYTNDYINDRVERFFQEFNAMELKSEFNQSTYEELRRFVFEYDQHQMNIKMQQRKDEQVKEKYYISSTLKGQELNELQEKFQTIWKVVFDDSDELKNLNIEIISQPKYPSNTK